MIIILLITFNSAVIPVDNPVVPNALNDSNIISISLISFSTLPEEVNGVNEVDSINVDVATITSDINNIAKALITCF